MTRITKKWIQHTQVSIYAIAVLLAIGVGLGQPGLSSVLEFLINPVLAILLYGTFLEIPFVTLRRAFTNGRFMAATLGMNFLVVPVVVFGLSRFLPQEPVLLVGVFMVLLTPCIDYVITFTDLAGGDSGQLTAATPVLMLVQLLILPVYLWMFMGQQVPAFIEAGPFIEAFVLIIALPLTLAWLTEVWADRGLEAYASTFWSALNGLDSADIEHAQEVGDFSRDHELEAGENVLTRDEEYLISMEWVVETARTIGFKVILAEPVNSLGGGLVLLRK